MRTLLMLYAYVPSVRHLAKWAFGRAVWRSRVVLLCALGLFILDLIDVTHTVLTQQGTVHTSSCIADCCPSN